MTRLITIELCQKNGNGHPSVKSYERLLPSEAKVRMATRMNNRHYYRVAPADMTGAIPGDEDRYAADLDAIANA